MNKLLIAVIFSSLLCSPAFAADIVKIGVIVPLSGEMSFAGVEVQNGMVLAREHLKKTNFEYQLIFEDNALDLKRSVSAAKKLIEVDKVDVVVTLWPPTANVVAPLTEGAQILHYTIAWDPSIAKSHRFILSHQAMVDDFVNATLGLLQGKGVTKLAFFQLNESGFNIGTDIFKSRSHDYGIDLVDVEVFNAGNNDFRSQLLKTLAYKPDGVLIWAVLPEIEIFLRQLRERKYSGFVTGFFDVVSSLSLIEGLPFVSEVHSTDEFRRLYKDRFGRDFVLKAPNAFDIVNLLVSAFEESPQKKLSAGELKARLTKVRNYHGAVGTVSIDEFGNSSYPPAYKKVFEGHLKEVGIGE